MFFDLFDHAFIISLPTRADRRAEMARELKKAGRSVDDARVEFFDAVRPDDAGDFPSIGARGCFMSHLGVLGEAARRGLDAVAVFEDDLGFPPDFQTRSAGIARALRDVDWDIFYGGYEDIRPTPDAARPIVRIAPTEGFRTSHFIVFRGGAIARARDYLAAMLARPAGSPQGGPMHVDGAYCWFRKDNPDLSCWLAAPKIGDQRSSRSDIFEGGRWFDRTPIVRDGATIARRLFRRS